MMQRILISTTFFLAALFLFSAPASAVSVDLVLVLDNSGSMMKNDPAFLTQKAVTEFVDQLSSDARVAMIIFDQGVRLAVPLSDLNYDTREAIRSHMEDIDYRGKYTDSPSAIERAIYELKTGGRPAVEKAIIFMTDGIVDTGDKARDRDKVQWLKNDLTQYAAQSGIQIFGIAFTENADFQLIQSLALRTEGLYFRAPTPESIENVFFRIHEALAMRHNQKIEMEAKAAEMEKAAAAPAPPPLPPEPAPKPEPVVKATAPVNEIPAAKEKAKGYTVSWSLVAFAAIFVFGIIAVLFLMMGRKGQAKKLPQVVVSPPVEPEDYIPEAILTDIQGVTGKECHKISHAVTKIGKFASREGKLLNHIVIEKSTVSRRHASINYRDCAFWVVDKGSMNGTFLNNHRLTKEQRLKSGDLLKFDTYEFEFAILASEPDEEEKTMVAAEVFKPAAVSTAAPNTSDPVPQPPEPPRYHPKPWILPDENVSEPVSPGFEKNPPIARDSEKTVIDDDDEAETLID
jgi:pSer/pThr/pTyr-binding forkhead associated (FHA) protein